MASGQVQILRKMLEQRVPPFTTDKLVRDLCEEVLQAFGSLYPDQALNLCMRIAHRLSTDEHRRPATAKSSFVTAKPQKLPKRKIKPRKR